VRKTACLRPGFANPSMKRSPHGLGICRHVFEIDRPTCLPAIAKCINRRKSVQFFQPNFAIAAAAACPSACTYRCVTAADRWPSTFRAVSKSIVRSIRVAVACRIM